jgi:hypothetical protein
VIAASMPLVLEIKAHIDSCVGLDRPSSLADDKAHDETETRRRSHLFLSMYAMDAIISMGSEWSIRYDSLPRLWLNLAPLPSRPSCRFQGPPSRDSLISTASWHLLGRSFPLSDSHTCSHRTHQQLPGRFVLA